jgi:hypothetical protein
MSINSVHNDYSAPLPIIKSSSAQSGSSSASKSTPSIGLSEGYTSASVTPSVVDFTSMTPREFGNLYALGGFSDLPPIALPKAGLDLTKDTSQQMYAMQDEKVNYIDLISKQIAFKDSIGASSAQESRTLNEMLEMQGKFIQHQPVIDSHA